MSGRLRFVATGMVCALWLGVSPGTVMAMPTIGVGDHQLLPETANQAVEIFVSGGQEVGGINFFAQVGDGGPELADFGLPAGTRGPRITAVNLLTGTIFDGFPAQQQSFPGFDALPQVASEFALLTEVGQTVPADGLLATLTIDTTGLDLGPGEHEWDLLLSEVLSDAGGPFATNFAPDPAEIENGTIRILSDPIDPAAIPEPVTPTLTGLAALALLLRGGRRRAPPGNR